MGVQKPAKSKAAASVLDQNVFVGGTTDPCCVPGGTKAGVLEAKTGGADSSLGNTQDGIGHILPPTAH
jgi:hypothetical protein